MKKIVLGIGIFLSLSLGFGEVFLPKIFSENMMFQREVPVKIWGKGEAGSEILVKFGGNSSKAKVAKDGKWELYLKEMPASKEPRSMQIFEDGKLAVSVENILVGEVWILGGQSNMSFNLKSSFDGKNAVKRADYPNLRYFKQIELVMENTEQYDSPEGAKWEIASANKCGFMSAVGFYFAEKLMKDLDVPVGLISTPLGGSAMVAWLPKKYANDEINFKKDFELFEKNLKNYDFKRDLTKWEEANAKFDEQVKYAKEQGKEAPKKSWYLKNRPNEMSPRTAHASPSYLWNAKVAPIAGFSSRGFLWYQGEADSWTHKTFTSRFKHLIEAWRKEFNNEDMPFYWVQLTSYEVKNLNWAYTRWAQYQTLKEVKNAGMVNIIDIGEKNDIHPRNKTDVGHRLENLILKDVYGVKNIIANSPEAQSFEYGTNSVKVKMQTFGSALVVEGDMRGFELKIDDEWVQADAKLEGSNIVVSAKNASDKGKISGVRYLWKSWAQPDVCVYNKQGLPALSFIDER